MHTDKGIWVFGYGSLIYKPPPHFAYRVPAHIYGFARRFWQSSIDHRGTPRSPGRVVTLIPFEEIIATPSYHEDLKQYHHSSDPVNSPEDLTTLGVVYYIPEEHVGEVRDYLNLREQNGYSIIHQSAYLQFPKNEREEIDQLPQSYLEDGKGAVSAIIYIGKTDNEAFIGPEDVIDTAKVIAHSRGPSGSNYEYLMKLHKAIHEMNKSIPDSNITVKDKYLIELLELVNKIRRESEPDIIRHKNE